MFTPSLTELKNLLRVYNRLASLACVIACSRWSAAYVTYPSNILQREGLLLNWKYFRAGSDDPAFLPRYRPMTEQEIAQSFERFLQYCSDDDQIEALFLSEEEAAAALPHFRAIAETEPEEDDGIVFLPNEDDYEDVLYHLDA